MAYFAATLHPGATKLVLSSYARTLGANVKHHAHHVTIIPPPEFDKNDSRLNLKGNKVRFKVDAIGSWKNGVLALRVDPKDPLAKLRRNGTAHLTVATAPGFSPKDSNNITDWKPLRAPFVLEAVLTVEK